MRCQRCKPSSVNSRVPHAVTPVVHTERLTGCASEDERRRVVPADEFFDVAAYHRHHIIGQADAPRTCLAFGVAVVEDSLYVCHGLVYANGVALEIEVVDAKRGKLTDSQTAVSADIDERVPRCIKHAG